MLVTGQLPFNGNSKPEVYGKIRKGVYKQPKGCSKNCIDLIAKMLTVDPKARPSAMECIQHTWFKEMEGADGSKLAQDPAHQQQILLSLKQFKG